jgi:micrococcal nuclease
MTKIPLPIVAGAILLAIGLATQRSAHPSPAARIADAPKSSDSDAVVARAVDGDTIELTDGRTVRYLGIDTPETVDPRKAVQCFGHEASDANRSLVQGQHVRLVHDIENTDKYGRLLRYVYLSDGTFVNLDLVANGYARAYTWPPNIAHATEFVAAQNAARTAGRGLWTACADRTNQ